jgi:DNA-binding transcriptional LysR family regulator
VLMRQMYPHVDVHFMRGSSAGLYRKVLDGDLDAAIISEPPFPISKSCEWRLLREEPLIVLTRARAKALKPHAILASEPFIRLDRSTWEGRLVDGYLRKAGIRPRESFETDGIDAIAVMVDRGLGVSLLPDWAPPWPGGLSLAKLPVPDHSIARRIGLVWPRTSLRIRLVRAFLEQAAAARAQGVTRKRASSRARERR